jgi:hypothetical protein
VVTGGIKISEQTCKVCNSKFHLHDHKSGLVFDDQFFLCEKCSLTMSDEDINSWTKSVMQDPETGMPIGLWLIQEHNKDKPLFSQKKD